MESRKKLDLNKKIYVKYETQIKCVVIMYIYYYCALYLFDISEKIPTIWATRWFCAGLYILLTVPIVLVQKKWGAYEPSKVNFKSYKQYIYGFLTLIPYYGINVLVIGFDSHFGLSCLGMSIWDILWCFFYYVIVVGVTEEYIFRIFFQGELTKIFGKVGWLAPVVVAVLFALAHVPQGYIEQVYIAFGAGLLMGYARYFIKEYSFLSLIIAHGFYDFLIVMLL